MTPALAYLDNPSQVPAAALSRLRNTADALRSEAPSGGGYRDFLSASSVTTARSADVLRAALTGGAVDALKNAERVAFAGARLFDEDARRASGGRRAAAMRRAGLFRDWWNDVRLTRRGFVSEAPESGAVTPIRILPGAESSLEVLSADPLLFASTWDLQALADRLTRWVAVA